MQVSTFHFQFSAVQCNSVQCNLLYFVEALCRAVQFGEIMCDAILCTAIRCIAALCVLWKAIHCTAVLCSFVLWNSLQFSAVQLCASLCSVMQVCWLRVSSLVTTRVGRSAWSEGKPKIRVRTNRNAKYLNTNINSEELDLLHIFFGQLTFCFAFQCRGILCKRRWQKEASRHLHASKTYSLRCFARLCLS